MRQLTSLDSQFLALETRRQTGHVGSVAILDPSTTPSAALAVAGIEALITDRLPLLPPLRCRLLEVPLGLDYRRQGRHSHGPLPSRTRRIRVDRPEQDRSGFGLQPSPEADRFRQSRS